MHEKTEQHLQQDAQQLQQLAASRLDARQFNAQIDAQLEQIVRDQNNAKTPRQLGSPWLAFAAAVALTAMAWLFFQQPNNTPEATSPSAQVVAAETPPALDLMQWPRAVEAQVNQPLLDEQQAIIADLKALKSRLLSI